MALRLHHAHATSVPFERAFSALKFIHSPLRNSLTDARVDKLQFIYLNSRVLRRWKAMENASLKEVVKEKKLAELAELSIELEDDVKYTIHQTFLVRSSA
jgi:hypothetical protein